MINIQPVQKLLRGDGRTVEVHSIFRTIQGEGPYTGYPATFVRLAGCNLQCPACDTEYTGESVTCMSVDAVVDSASQGPKLVVITGGEPFRQNITPLAERLLSAGKVVQVETNGTLPLSQNFPEGVTIVCSPKTSTLQKSILESLSCYKYVLDSRSVGEDGLPTVALGNAVASCVARPEYGKSVYLQPLDVQQLDQNSVNLAACVKSCMEHGYILQLQTHKLIGVE